MRLKSITIRNYRVHRDVTVPLDESRTLIGGPNECGKSTLVEAVHRALFLKSKVTGDVQKSMVSSRFAGSPEVEVAFTAAGSDYLLTKRFSGTTGSTRLVELGGSTWSGEEAETHLNSLLKVEDVGGGRGVGERAAQQWSHLWVWQGQSGSDPSEHATLQRDCLLQRLQQTGGAAALQSDLDARLAARFAAAREAIFTQAGKPKTGSELDKAGNAKEEANADRLRAAERVEKLRGAVRDFEQSTQIIETAKANLQKLNLQKEAVDAKQARVSELRANEAAQLPGATAAADKHQTLKRVDSDISGLRVQVQELQDALKPRNEETTRLAAALEEARQLSTGAAQSHETAANRARTARLLRDLDGACVTRFETDVRLQELLVKHAQVLAHQNELTRLREELAKLPEVATPKLKKLQKLEAEMNQSEAALKAMAAGIEVIAAREPVQVGGDSLVVGQSQVVTEPTEIVVGHSLRLRISPGGGTSLQEARNQAQESRRDLREQLDVLGITSVAEASEVHVRRQDLAVKIDNAEAALESLDAINLPAALAEARQAAAAALAEVERRSTQVPDFTSPVALADAKPRLAAAELAVNEAESAETQSKKLRDTEAKKFASAETALKDHQSAIAQQNNQLIGLNAQLQLLLRTHGDDAARAAALAEAKSTKDAAESLLTATRRALAELQPELLETDQKRLKRACEQAGETKRDAETARAVAEAALRSDGSDDPEAGLALATARAISAQDHLASVRRKAEAIRLLDQLFLEEQRALAERFTSPFAERISVYLQCLFGVGARATVTLANNAFAGLQLVRPSIGGGAVPFDSLSGGAREQVAAAVRLAMAEILAADHDGCLPLVFDDAFAYSDPERVQTLQRMLDLAAANGLQLIILSCTPSDYAALGASRVLLREERPPSTGPTIGLRSGSYEGSCDTAGTAFAPDSMTEEMATPSVNAYQRDELLARLRELGGKSGNYSLREALGWQETAYNAVKDDLVASGRLVLGKGRGGSVALPSA
jgi:energy-coupling factor transporter ATP-binding protein EcfA2